MNRLFFLIPLIINFFLYRCWLISKEIIGGDWPYFYSEFIKSLPLLVPSWSSYQGNGLGGMPIAYALDSYLYIISSIFVRGMSIPWNIVYKIFYFGAFIAGSLYSAYYLIHAFSFRVRPWQSILALIIYSTNTYILMVVGGGQLGVALAFAFAPWALGHWINLIQDVISEKSDILQKSLVTGVSFAVVILFDARIAYLVALAVSMYFIVYVIDHVGFSKHSFVLSLRSILKNVTYIFGLPALTSLFLHASWILPIFVYRTTPLDNLVTNYTSSGAFIFHSFATFSNGISLLHPNWPENIFGKVYFLRPEFLVLPVLAFSPLVWIGQKTVNIRFLALLALIGVFLAKGANEPFGFVNIWMYEKIPGFTLFRDPTKWFLFIALSYSVLIPLAIEQLSVFITSKKIIAGNNEKNILSRTVYCLLFTAFLIFWLFTTRQAVIGQLQGTFSKRSVPAEYVQLKNILSQDRTFSRTLWVPRQNRFSFYTNIHPSIEVLPLFHATNSGELIERMQKINLKEYLTALSIKYVIVPFDVYGEIFVRDRKYDDSQWYTFIRLFDASPWLIKRYNFGKLTVYEVPEPLGHFYSTAPDGRELIKSEIQYKEVSTASYTVEVAVDRPSVLVFAEQYNPYWEAKSTKATIRSVKTYYGLNGFMLESPGRYTLTVNFQQEKVYNYGRWISIATLVILVCTWVISGRKNHGEYEI